MFNEHGTWIAICLPSRWYQKISPSHEEGFYQWPALFIIHLPWYHQSPYKRKSSFKISANKDSYGMKGYEEINLSFGEDGYLIHLSFRVLPWCLKPIDFGQAQNAELHHFGDAPQIAYETVSHARLVNENRRIHCSFLAGKSRLAHMKQITITWLKLSAAVLAVRTNQTLQEEFHLKFDKTVFWSDSTAPLQYIKNEDKRFYTFVANRLVVI